MIESGPTLALFFDQDISKSIVLLNTPFLTHKTGRLRENILLQRDRDQQPSRTEYFPPKIFGVEVTSQRSTSYDPTSHCNFFGSTELFMCTHEPAATTTHVQLSTRGLLNKNRFRKFLIENGTLIPQQIYPLSLFKSTLLMCLFIVFVPRTGD